MKLSLKTAPTTVADAVLVLSMLFLPLSASAEAVMDKDKDADGKDGVSYYEDIRPIFQAKCHGCHQPAKAKGDYVMTTHQRLLSGGEEGQAITPGKPDDSYLMEQIMPVDGKAEMPKKEDPLAETEIALIGRWIAEGAVDDTPENARGRYDMDHPPQYIKPPVITSLDFSPDGALIAVAGFHEVLLHNADGSGLVARLVGLSERIESARFSPDGSKLAVTGGLPGRMGEVQVWDVAKRELELSVPVTFDTVYGASWSPDGKLIAFGCTDNSVRAIDSGTGKQVLYQGAHNDWALDTAFSLKGTHIMSVGRDMATKLTEVETERFVDNITSITPGALKGGIAALVRHPKRDEILVGGSDGTPQTFRILRETARKIGDNANLVRRFPPMEGRIWSVSYRPDGNRIAAGSSFNGKGAVNIYSSEFDMVMPKEVAQIYSEAVREDRKSGSQKILDDYHTQSAELLRSIPLDTAIYAVAFSPDGGTVAASGEDGLLRLIDAESGEIRETVLPVTLASEEKVMASDQGAGSEARAVSHAKGKAAPDIAESLPKGRNVAALEISPESLALSDPNQYHQLLVTARLDSGETVDVTRLVTWQLDKPLLEISKRGLAEPREHGQGVLTAALAGQSATAAVTVDGLDLQPSPNFIRDVNPIISRLGCNAGTCHGSKEGKNGFKLSLRGYDPIFDVRAFADDHGARRVNMASTDDSLMLLKATGAVPHEGGQVTQLNSKYYRIIRDWIAAGTPLNLQAPKVESIELAPRNPVIQDIGSRQQIRVVATYADGVKRDVTAEAFIESGNTEVAINDDFGLITTIRRGEAPVLARFEGAYAATTVTVMGDRTGFEWATPPAYNRIDELVAAKWQRMQILPSELCTDAEFIRRVHLDLTGLPPTADEVRRFVADESPARNKRDALIDVLIGSPPFIDHWTNKWADMLMVNSKFLGPEGATAFREWIRGHVEKNTPYNEFVRQILTASGSNKDNPAASYFKILREPVDMMENTTHLFLATRFNCNKCHDHPFERWNQNQYYETAAYFARTGLKADAENSGDQKIGGTAVEGAKPLYEIAYDMPEGEVTHERTGKTAPPKFPFAAKFNANPEATRREQLAAWLTSDDNAYFAMSYANRIWGYLLGTGVIEPLDDIRAGNPPSNPDLLNWLTSEFVNSGFDARHLMRLICQSRTYQLSIASNKWNEDDEINFSHAKARRLPAEVLFDAVYAATGSTPSIPGAKPGMRAAELPDVQLDLKSGFLANLGRPPRESACECERSNDVQLGSVMALLSGPAIADAVGDPGNAIAKLVLGETDDSKMIEEIFLRVLNRAPAQAEVDAALGSMAQIESDHKNLIAALSKREAEMVPVRAEQERKRFIAVNKAQADIAAYTPEYTRKKAEAEAAQNVRIAAAQKAADAHLAQTPSKVDEWQRTLGVDRLWTAWTPLTPKTATANGGIQLVVQGDGSVLASGAIANTDYTITAETDLANITGVMLEALPDDNLPGFGPGINPNGNFVVTEFKLEWGPKAGAGKKLTPVKFSDAVADFNQKGFDVKNAINGDIQRSDKGWAVATQERQPHWARFQLATPLNAEKGLALTFSIINRYSDGDYPLGKFRIWVTTSTSPLDPGLPSAVAEILKTSPQTRSPEQNDSLANYYRGIDPESLKLRFALAQEMRPLPADPAMEQLKAALTGAERPVPQDPLLEQLRQDVKYSIEQSADRRLTTAQDLTWALINNPAFLFNH